jgi:Probable zinc-ribbon domain
MQEKRIICNQCGNPFVFTVSEQQRITSLGFDAPKRCGECRRKKIKDGPSRHEVKMKYKRQKSKSHSEDVFDH